MPASKAARVEQQRESAEANHRRGTVAGSLLTSRRFERASTRHVAALRETVNRGSLLCDALPADRAHRGPPRRHPRADRRPPRSTRSPSGGYASAGVQAVAARAGVAVGHRLPPLPVEGRPVRRGLPARLAARARRRGRGRPPTTGARAARARGGRRRGLLPGARSPGRCSPTRCSPSRSTRPSRPSGCASASATATPSRACSTTACATASCARTTRATVAAALVGALGEALVGPLSAGATRGSHEPLIATLVQFCEEALPRAHERVHA